MSSLVLRKYGEGTFEVGWISDQCFCYLLHSKEEVITKEERLDELYRKYGIVND